jgi:hypothetical protein
MVRRGRADAPGVVVILFSRTSRPTRTRGAARASARRRRRMRLPSAFAAKAAPTAAPPRNNRGGGTSPAIAPLALPESRRVPIPNRRAARARGRLPAEALRKRKSVRGPEALDRKSPLRFQSRARTRRFKSRGFVNPETFPICRARWMAHAKVRAASISRGARRVQPNGVSGSGCGPARCPPVTMATPPVTVKEVVSVRARALARRPNPRRAIFRSGVSGCLLGAPNPSSPRRAPSAAHERRHQPAMHLFHQPHDGEREVHLRARDGRVQQRGHRRHGQPAAADEEVRE